jgi:hypothetical protein
MSVAHDFSHLNLSSGTVTRSQAWNSLVSDGLAKKTDLLKAFSKFDPAQWKEEKDLYPEIIYAMQSTVYANIPGVFVVDTHDKGDFRPNLKFILLSRRGDNLGF